MHKVKNSLLVNVTSKGEAVNNSTEKIVQNKGNILFFKRKQLNNQIHT